MCTNLLAGKHLMTNGFGFLLLFAGFTVYLFNSLLLPLFLEEEWVPCDNKPVNGSFPRRIHQIWNDKNMPERWQHASQTCKDLYPGYEYKLWTYADLDSFIAHNYPWFLMTFRDYPYDAQRVDASKYFLIHHFGGIYIDADVSCNSSFHAYLENLSGTSLKKDTVVRVAYPKGIGAEIIIAKAHNKFIEFVTHQLIPSHKSYGIKYATVMFTTGPHWFGNMYDIYPCKEEILIVPQEYYTGKYFIHYHNSGWHSWDGTVIITIYRHYVAFTILVSILLTALVMGYLLFTRRKNQTKSFKFKQSLYIVNA